LAAASRRMTCHMKVAGIIRKDCKRNEEERASQRLGPIRKNLWTTHKGKSEINYILDKRQLDVRKKRETAICVGGRSSGQLSPMGIKVPAFKTLQKTFKLQIVKRAKEVSSGLRKINRARSKGRICGSTGLSMSDNSHYCVRERDRSNLRNIVLNKTDEKLENTLHDCVCEIEKKSSDDYNNSNFVLTD
jgi:hypothetical protein